MKFKLQSEYKPTGDQPTAIKTLLDGLDEGDREQTLLGVTGSGKSVTGETMVMIKNKNRFIQKRIDEIVNGVFDHFSEHIQLSGTSQFINFNDLPHQESLSTLSFNPTSGHNSWEPLTQVSRHNVDKTVKIVLEDGRNISTTMDHNFYVVRSGHLILLEGEQLQEGDMVPVPIKIDSVKKPLNTISTHEYIQNKRGLYVTLCRKPTAAVLASFSGISYRKKWAMEFVSERISLTDYMTNSMHLIDTSQAGHIGSHRLTFEIPYKLELSDELLRLVGYYIAEGHSNKRYLTISSADKEIVDDVNRGVSSIGLKMRQRIKPYDYQINSLAFTRFMGDISGHTSYFKKLPSFWMELNNHQLSQILKAYYAGDGGVEKNGVYATTASIQLASDIQYAMLRFGISSRIRDKKVLLPSGNVGLYKTISITGKSNISKFQKYIGFSLSRKQVQLNKLVSRNMVENTNVDLIPLFGGDLLALRSRLNLSQRDVALASGLERSYISMIESDIRKPSRMAATKILEYLMGQSLLQKDTVCQNEVMRMFSLLNNAWIPIKSINIVEQENVVYDFGVSKNETFLAGNGGMFVHNTFTMANIIQDRQVPTLVLAHNKTLAAQLYSEFKSFFPENEVHYFVSYFDYYQPEAYMASSDTYIEKDSKINDEIDRLRHAATTALLTRKDVIIVASVSCIYGIGSPESYSSMSIHVKKGERRQQDKFVRLLTDIQYQRNDIDFHRGTFRVKGDVVDVFPAGSDMAYRIEFFGDEVDRLTRIDPLTGEIDAEPEEVSIFPSSHYVTPKEKLAVAIENIKKEFEERLEFFERHDKLLEAQRLSQRTKYDIEMLEETGFVKGIENYSRYLTNREPGEQPATLLDYFPDDFLLLVDESHMTLPQVRGMYNGDRARKEVLVEYGFRMPSALDNRPLTFAEFDRHINKAIYVSATPGDYELAQSPEPAQQIIRPTGLIDPEIIIRPTKGQIDDLVAEIRDRTAKNQRVLVTTLTKRMAEDLTTYLQEINIKTAYIHSEVDTLERGDILKDLRLGVYDVLVGINLLREGLDLPEVSMVAIMDADKEGFLRSSNALIQTIGRAARHLEGKVLMYGDRITDSMQKAIDETNRRRTIQTTYNEEHGITPESIAKEIDEGLRSLIPKKEDDSRKLNLKKIPKDEYPGLIKELTGQMELASANLEFEKAAELRDMINDLQSKL